MSGLLDFRSSGSFDVRSPRHIDLRSARYNGPNAVRLSAKIILLDSTDELLLQRRDADEPYNGGKLGAFGGGYDPTRRESDPREVGANELLEELLRNFNPDRMKPLRRFFQVLDKGPREVHYFFTRNRGRPLTDCKEGQIERYDGAFAILDRPDVGMNLKISVEKAWKRGLIPA